MEYTKGEWEQTIVKSNRSGIQGTNIYSEEGTGVIAHVYNTDQLEAAGNARLITAAPDIYEALVNIRALIVAQYPNLLKSYTYELIEKAITKAEGK